LTGETEVSKKHIILIAAAGILSFAAAFGFSFLTAKNAIVSAPAEAEAAAAEQVESVRYEQTGEEALSDDKGLTEKQLKRLVYDAKERIREYEYKLKELELREQRMRTAQDVLKEDIDKLNNLRVDLASMVTTLKEERDKLIASRITVEAAEKANLVSVAATYDKMDSASASQIFSNMSKMGAAGAGGIDEVVKILYYMTERTKAKVLAEMVSSEPQLAAVLSQRLKTISELE
jgi:flagellar motility protein MotE (MotC chaperone)